MKIKTLSFPDEFDVSWVEGMRWRMLAPFRVSVVIEEISLLSLVEGSFDATAPTGFVTDLASAPSVVWTWFPPEGQYTKAAAIHDYLYSVRGRVGHGVKLSRAGVDRVFYLGMKVLGVSEFKSRLMWLAVRTFGASHWGEENHGTERNGKETTCLEKS